MRIKSIEIENFRQFYGKQKAEFSIDPNQNISVVHGENGAGKTTLLNAFKWCFYGVTDFDKGDSNLLNDYALASAQDGKNITVKVTVEFERDGHRYTASRTQHYKKMEGIHSQPAGGNVFELSWIDKTGICNKATNPESHINQIMPEKMHSYFLFNGERIEKLAYASASNEIRDAIRTLMGLEIVERARSHLGGKVAKYFRNKIMEDVDTESRNAIQAVNDLIESIDQKKLDFKIQETNIASCDSEIQYISNELKSYEETAADEKKRDEYQERLNKIEDEQNDLTSSISKTIRDYGFLVFLSNAVEKSDTLLEERRKKGELPFLVKKRFIDDLLNKNECICGNSLEEGSAAFIKVSNFRTSVSSEGIEQAFINISGAITQFEPTKDEAISRIKSDLSRRNRLLDERNELQGKLEDITSKITSSELQKAVDLELKRSEYKEKRDNAVAKKFQIENELQLLKSDLIKARELQDRLKNENEKTALYRSRLNVTEECERALSALYDQLSVKTRNELSKRVNETFREILQKDYWAEIDDSYRLQVFKNIAGYGKQIVVGKSTGESQVTSLSFIGSIVSLAKQQHEREDHNFFKSGVFPIIMDSPFGSMDPIYKQAIARYIPLLADQIIIFVSGSQWKGEVENECNTRVGKHISLIYHAPTVGKDKESYYVRSGSDHEYTQFAEGYHG